MSTLIELAQLSNRITEKLLESNGEINDDISDMIDMRDVSVPQKIDSYSYIIDKLKYDIERFKEISQRYDLAARSLKKLDEKLKNNIKIYMQTQNINEVKGHEARFKLAKAKRKLIIDDRILPDIYKNEITTITIDKNKIHEELNLGGTIDGVSEEENFSLRKYINKTV